MIDSYDALNFVTHVIGSATIKQRIRSRQGRIVLRPDSGDPEIIDLQVLNLLADIFGTTLNDKGYRILNDNVGIIQGDGMKADTIVSLYEKIIAAGWSADNLIVGSGGGLLQEGFTRDTERFAIKAAYAETADGRHINIQKNPKTDMTKASKAGLLKVILDGNTIKTVAQDVAGDDLLATVYEDGKLSAIDGPSIIHRASL